MASNETPTSYNPVVALSEDAADGAKKHGAALGLKQNTEAAIRADLATLKGAQDVVGQKRTAKSDANAANQTADSNGKAFIARFIQLETPRIGADWGPLWEEAGFSDGSISIPRKQEDRYVLLGELKTFLHDNSTYAVTDPARPDLDVTEAAAGACYDAITTARAAINTAAEQNGTALTVRDTALAQMRARLTGLRGELEQIPLPDDSPIWYAFGFNRPDDPATPGQPDSLVLSAGAAGSGTLIVDWAPARRATGYRVKVQVAGEAKPREFPLVTDDQTTLAALPLGKLLTITVAAHNDAGDGPDSNPATITLA
jgi:hypothetical protein